ncbi:MAG: hypothetical protein AABX38_08225 [Candidatus Micrarchaeota archaeon]
MIRTTILIREDIYDALIRMFGKKNLSKGVNESLLQHLFKENKKKSMFGADPWLKDSDLSDLRDHDEHNF